MSYQTSASPSEVGKVLQEIVDAGHAEEIVMGQDENGQWTITADSKKFWTALLTPSEVRQLQSENQRLNQHLALSGFNAFGVHPNVIERFQTELQNRLNSSVFDGDPAEAKGLQRAMVILTDLLIEDRFQRQNLTEQCVSCSGPITRCGCEWSRRYFEWVKKQNELGEQWLKEQEVVEK